MVECSVENTKIAQVSLSAFVYRQFHEDASPLVGALDL